MEIPPNKIVVVKGQSLSRRIHVPGKENLGFEFREQIQELLTIHSPVVLIVGEYRIHMRENFSGDAKQFEAFLRETIGKKEQETEKKKKWKTNNKEANKKHNEKYYASGSKEAEMARSEWLQWEDNLILSPGRPSDQELSTKLQRTIRAIQGRRVKLRKA